jgi:predicted Zn-dependent protease
MKGAELYSSQQLWEAAERVLSRAEADQVEVVIQGGRSELTRIANSTIHQNTSEQQAAVSVRLVLGKKVGCARANSLEKDSLDELARKAREIALLQPENSEFVSLPEHQEPASVQAFDEEVAACSPAQRAEIAQVIINAAKQRELKAFGSVSVEATTLIVANSLGIRASHSFTSANLTALISDETSSGWGESRSWQLADLLPLEAAETAAAKCLQGREPIELEPGDYTVILEEPAVSDLLGFLAFVGLGAKDLQEGTSFMCDKTGQKVADEKITLWDDGLDPRGIPFPFDFEGVPKQKVMLLESGVAKNVVYDSFTANREGKKSTGHAFLAPNPYGPYPSHLFLATGSATKEEMIASIERGLLVTRFHYTNVVHPKLAIITGMTRDGTFLIEKGAIRRGVKNFRFTQSILEALERVSMVASQGKLGDYSWAPALKIDSFHFSGKTQF